MKKKNDAAEYTARHAVGEQMTTEQQPNTTEFPRVGEPSMPVVSELIPPVQEDEPPKKHKGWLARRKEERRRKKELLLEEETADEDMRVAEETASAEISDDTREISLSPDGAMETTRVIELAEEGGSHIVNDEPETAQMLLEGFADEEEDKLAEPGQEETLRRIRQEKIQDFSQRREQHKRELAEAEQAEQAAEEVPPAEQTEEAAVAADEAEPMQETMETLSLTAMRERLQQQVHRSGVALLVSALLEAILFLIAAVSAVSPAIAIDPMTYLGIQLVLFIGLLAASGDLLRAGFAALFKKRKVTTEGAVALVSLLTAVHTALLALNVSGVADGSAPVLTGVAGFGLLLMQVAHRLEINRAVRDFGVFSSKQEKLVMKRIADEAVAEEIGRPAVALGVPRVSYFRRTATTEGCVEQQGYDPAAGFLGWYLPVVTVVSLVVALVYLLINGFTAWIFAVTLLCGMLIVSMPVLMVLSLYTTLFAADKKVRAHRAAIADYRAAEVYGDSHAVALDAMELFPENSVLLHGIKTFSGTRVDEAILDAASVSVRAGGPLSHVFRRMIQNKVDMLHEVDTLVYEQDMGLSGWISGRRILIGNRRLLDNHGIDIPSKDYEERYAKNGRQLVYLSIAGELSAMFVVSYTADPAVKRAMKALTERRITLLVRTCDQNVTESLITSVFDLNGYYVELLNAPAGRSFEALVSGVSESEPAQIVSAGGALGMLTALAQCRRLRTGVRLFAVLQALLGLFGIVLVALSALVGGLLFPPLYVIEYLAGGAVLLSLIALLFAKN